MVRAIRTPSSSSSERLVRGVAHVDNKYTRTNVDGLDPDALFNVSSLRGVADLVGENLGLAKGVHEGGTTSARSTYAFKLSSALT